MLSKPQTFSSALPSLLNEVEYLYMKIFFYKIEIEAYF